MTRRAPAALLCSLLTALAGASVLALALGGCPDETSGTQDVTVDTASDVTSDTANDTVAPDAPTQDTPTEDTPVQDDAPIGDTPAQDTPGQDTPSDVPADVPADVGPEVTLPDGPIYSMFIGDWDMSPGEETTRCVVKKLDNPTTINVAAIRTTLAPGSHHLIVYRVADQAEQPNPTPCTPFVETLGGSAAPLAITQIPQETIAFPEGVVMELEPNQTIRLEAHYLNYYPDQITAHADVEFLTTTETDVQKADFLFYGTTDILLSPQSEFQTPWQFLDVPNGAKVFAITGHTHEFGTNVVVTKSTSASDPGVEMYPKNVPFLWDEAPILYNDPPVEFQPGEGFRFRCSWNNTSDSFVFFGESANQEMCFLWAYYYPSQGFRLCAKGLFGCPSDG